MPLPAPEVTGVTAPFHATSPGKEKGRGPGSNETARLGAKRGRAPPRLCSGDLRRSSRPLALRLRPPQDAGAGSPRDYLPALALPSSYSLAPPPPLPFQRESLQPPSGLRIPRLGNPLSCLRHPSPVSPAPASPPPRIWVPASGARSIASAEGR